MDVAGQAQRDRCRIQRRWSGPLRRGVAVLAVINWLGIAAVLTGGAALAKPEMTAAARLAFTHAVTILPPANSRAGSSNALTAVDCVQAGACLAGGWYTDSQNSQQPMVARESGGKWTRARELVLPRGADPNPFARVRSVDCTAIGYCTATGYYNGATHLHGFIATETAGSWARAFQVRLPAGSAATKTYALGSVACTAPRYCTGAGGYDDTDGKGQAMVVTKTAGTWKQAIRLRPPAHGMDAGLGAIACPQTGNCSAVGGYYDSTTGDGEIFAVTESAGRWHQAIKVTPPGIGPPVFVFLGSVACTRPGTCTAVGGYEDIGGRLHMMEVNQSHGVWLPARLITMLPPDAMSDHPNPVLASIACITAGSCVAVGYYNPNHSQSGALAEFETHGTWSKTARIPPPRRAAIRNGSQAFAVSCTRRGYCAAVGQYLTQNGVMTAMAAATQ